MLATQTRGRGPRAVLLLHGFLGSGRNLASVARSYVERDPGVTVHLVDLPGHGDSPPPGPAAGLADLADAVLETAWTLASGAPVAIVGHSLGGRVALAALWRQPEALTDVTVLDVSPGARSAGGGDTVHVLEVLLAAPATAPDRATLRAALAAELPRTLVDWLLLNTAASPEGVRWKIDREALRGLLARTDETDLWSALEPRPARPVHVIRGARSGYVSDADAARLEHAGVRVDTLADAGHFVHVDALDALMDLLVPHAPAAPASRRSPPR